MAATNIDAAKKCGNHLSVVVTYPLVRERVSTLNEGGGGADVEEREEGWWNLKPLNVLGLK